jgi:hypothetical protein
MGNLFPFFVDKIYVLYYIVFHLVEGGLFGTDQGCKNDLHEGRATGGPEKVV